MVSIRYRYLVASRLAFNEVWGLRKANWQQLYTIQQQDLSLKSLRKSLADKTAADSICSDELKLKTTEIEKKDSIIFNTKNLYLDATFKANDKKWTIVGLGVSLPVALALGIALGWVLHYR